MPKTKSKESAHYGLIEGKTIAYSWATRQRMSRCVNIAKAMFSKGVSSNGRTMNFCFACVKGKIISIGVNDYKKIMDRYVPQLKTNYRYYGEKSYRPSLHAEISCLLKLGWEDCSDVEFYSIRLNKQGKCSGSKPCDNCARILKMVGFKHVWYFDNDMNMMTL